MAYYAALLSTIELLEDILHPQRSPNSFLGYIPTFNSLHKKFSQLLDSLQDYSFIDHGVDPVEVQIRDASYQALDFIESQIPEHRQLVLLGRFDLIDKLHEVGQEVDSIVQHITAIKQAQMREHVVAAVSEQHQQQPAPIDVGNTPVGFEDQVLEIKELICGSSSQLQVIPIVGMGGIGKTTLARHTLHDLFIVSQFDFRGWVTISQDYDVVRVLQDIVKSLGIDVTLPDNELSGRKEEPLGEEHERKIERALKNHIYQYLIGRKFLIVIDDIWNTQVWDDIKHIFPNDYNGSRVVLTTRLGDVAEYAGCTDSIHHMKFLNADASWTLFQEKAFAKNPCPSELVNIGKQIAGKCSGLPIAIVVIGGILSNDKTLQYWENVAENVGSCLSEDDEYLSNILCLSYNHLPHHLKPCFLYMGSYPEDYEINVSKLIKLWIAEGFLKTIGKSNNLEEIGNAYLEDLVKRNLVIITKNKSCGKFKSCIMHDVLRDFCRQRGLKEHFLHVVDREGHLKTNGMEKVRRIFVNPIAPFKSWAYYGIGKDVWTICRFRKKPSSIYLDDLRWNKVKVLKILDVAHLSTPAALPAVSKMSHLKYLALHLHCEGKYCIDPSIFNLQNLETLIVYLRGYLQVSLPCEIWKMSSLKYLIIDRMMLPPIPSDILLQKLECLHTLRTPNDFVFANDATQMIPNVRKLKLRYDVGMRGNDTWKLYGLNSLFNLLQLEKLAITFHSWYYFPPCDFLSRSGFSFPQNLKKLSLQHCKLRWNEMTLIGSLNHLQVLKLRDDAFVGAVWGPVEGEFLELKFLLLERLDLWQWWAESMHFPKLQHLKIIKCEYFKIPLDIGEIGMLKFITVENSQKAEVSAMKILKEQNDLGNYGLQVIVHNETCL